MVVLIQSLDRMSNIVIKKRCFLALVGLVFGALVWLGLF